MPWSSRKKQMIDETTTRTSYFDNLSKSELEQKLFLKNGVIYSKDGQVQLNQIRILNVSIMNTLVSSVMNPINQWLIFLFLFYIIFDSEYAKIFILMLELILNFSINLYRNYKENERLVQSVISLLSTEVGYIKLSQSLISRISISSLKVGDLVYFKRGDTIPINILVLDSKDDEIILQKWRGTGQTCYSTKHPVKLTRVMKQGKQKIQDNLIFYKQIMNGRIQFNSSAIENHQFKGYIKLQKDPKGEQLTIDNVILKNTFNSNTDWYKKIIPNRIIGMVLENSVEAMDINKSQYQ